MKITIEPEWENGSLIAGSQTLGWIFPVAGRYHASCFGNPIGDFDTAEAAMREVEITVDAELGGVMAP